ncbi:uncharacterized protein LOC144865980 [Branchiostoma floridae x Branchiostoma japonicum]
MAPRKKTAKVKKSTSARGRGRGKGARVKEAHEEPSPVAEDTPSPPVSEIVDPRPPPTSQIEIVAEVHQEDAQPSSDSDGDLSLTESRKKRKGKMVTTDVTEEQEEDMDGDLSLTESQKKRKGEMMSTDVTEEQEEEMDGDLSLTESQKKRHGETVTDDFTEGQEEEMNAEVSPSSEDAKSQKKRRRVLVTVDFNEEQEQEMVEWLQAPEQNCLLNKTHPNYIKRGLKDALWEHEATEMGKSSSQLKKWYSNMRTRFGKIKLTPSGSGNTELTARDHWILRHFEFLRPYLIVHGKKRVTVSMKAKVQATAAAAAAAGGAPNHDSDDHHSPPLATQSDEETFPKTSPTDDTEVTKGNIAELQRQLLNKLSKAEKTPMERQKDAFADFMKEATYTFPPPMWLRFQGEVNSLLQKYQLELHQQSTMQTLHQQQDGFLRSHPPVPIPVPSSQQCLPMSWQPHPSQWPGQVNQPTSVWGSQEASWVQQQFQPHPLVRRQSAPPTYTARTPPPSSTPIHSKDMANFTGLSGFNSVSCNNFTQSNQDDDQLNTPCLVVHSPTLTQQSEQSEYGSHE